MFPSHRPSVRRIDTPLSLHAALLPFPLARHCCPSASPTETPSVRLYPVQSLCHALCLPASRSPARARMPLFRNRTNRPSLSIRPSLRPGKALKAACCSAGRAAAAPMGAGEKRENGLHSTSLPPTQYLDRRGTTTETHRRPPPEAPPAPGGRGRRKKRRKTMS